MPSTPDKPTVSVKLSKGEPGPATTANKAPDDASQRDGTSTSSTSSTAAQPGDALSQPAKVGLSQPCLVSGIYSAASAGMV